MGVQRVDVTARSAAPLDVVHALVADGASWPVWGQWQSYQVEQADPDGGDGVGAIRVLRRGRYTTRERVVELTERRFSYDLLSGLAIRDYRAHLDLEPDGAGTRLHWHSSFRPKVPGTGALYRAALTTFIADSARLLAAHAERTTGEPG